MSVQFLNGTTKTLKELAEEIEAEGRLGRGEWYSPSTGLRCTLGVIEQVTGISYEGRPVRERELGWGGMRRLFFEVGASLSNLNDDFEGSPEERCVYIAGLLRSAAGRENGEKGAFP